MKRLTLVTPSASAPSFPISERACHLTDKSYPARPISNNTGTAIAIARREDILTFASIAGLSVSPHARMRGYRVCPKNMVALLSKQLLAGLNPPKHKCFSAANAISNEAPGNIQHEVIPLGACNLLIS